MFSYLDNDFNIVHTDGLQLACLMNRNNKIIAEDYLDDNKGN